MAYVPPHRARWTMTLYPDAGEGTASFEGWIKRLPNGALDPLDEPATRPNVTPR